MLRSSCSPAVRGSEALRCSMKTADEAGEETQGTCLCNVSKFPSHVDLHVRTCIYSIRRHNTILNYIIYTCNGNNKLSYNHQFKANLYHSILYAKLMYMYIHFKSCIIQKCLSEPKWIFLISLPVHKYCVIVNIQSN